ncbi:hypothetical protein [Chondrinema litorale]|uniref:hypothetical protein n=1 Tax=Chondrinema litorale TaxID=2994555 RepID=UPI00254316D1|nr:hypothetical protein [Chondrinema litorale]UZR97746.1 hypothetical protein OQ292_27450 [Chondrinema litorale]
MKNYARYIGKYNYDQNANLTLKEDSTFEFSYSGHMISGSSYGTWKVINEKQLEFTSSYYDSIFITESIDTLSNRIKFISKSISETSPAKDLIYINDSVEFYINETSWLKNQELNKFSFLMSPGFHSAIDTFYYQIKNPRANVFIIRRYHELDILDYDTFWYKIIFEVKKNKLITRENVFYPEKKLTIHKRLRFRK